MIFVDKDHPDGQIPVLINVINELFVCLGSMLVRRRLFDLSSPGKERHVSPGQLVLHFDHKGHKPNRKSTLLFFCVLVPALVSLPLEVALADNRYPWRSEE